MQFRTTGLMLLGAMALPASGAAQTTAAPIPAALRLHEECQGSMTEKKKN
jgi:hypothetical protein